MARIALALLSLFFLCGCVRQEALLKPTASGYAEGIFRGSSVDQVKGGLIECCEGFGAMLYEDGPNRLEFERPCEGGDALLATFLIGNSYSTPPMDRLRFSIYQRGDNVKVTAQEWIETQMAFGQIRKMELRGNNQRNAIQRMLFSLGAE